jgi:hypothetical protein
MLTSPLHLVLRLRISGVKLVHPLYAFMEGTGATLRVSLQWGATSYLLVDLTNIIHSHSGGDKEC